ncbi:Protein of unknown function [Halobacillus dabanensis]|uniref:DUF1659 domain-containing protein n=1 Tax=Halobacillus dabanensis TaxID=240302 RepID=A0A1I3V5U1_HALDA|nr:DUF1659 domain-containing protein [Halobacillus dabanensis]SFJ90645.1 Protein of unknown function [Halobacillus dabanensis]
MAVNTIKVDTRLQLVLSEGQDGEGNMLLKKKSFNNVKMNAADEQLHTVAIALAPLQTHILIDIARDDRSLLIEE